MAPFGTGSLRWATTGAMALALAVLSGLGLWALTRALHGEELSTPYRHRDSDWAGSGTCRSCHPDNHASWYRTFHRTMTQEANPETVLGAFDGEVVTFWGRPARPVRRGDDHFIEYLDPSTGAVTQSMKVERTVGSRRYQQYLVKAASDPAGGTYCRVPLLWHVGEQRWIHLNGAFLGPDDHDYDKHLVSWNGNCIFCHNTGPSPGAQNLGELTLRAARQEPVDMRRDVRFESEVVELGIACESCHGPCDEHVKRNRSPLRRYALHLGGGSDPTTVNPAKLTKEQSVDVCGQCHGQRLAEPPESITDWWLVGPPYRAGERLTNTATPVTRETPSLGRDPEMFRNRFWADGTPRLTAYEYQGLTSSPCFLEGELTCVSCHSMHDGDVFGQLRPEMRTAAACAPCHPHEVEHVEEHSHHPAESAGASCFDCHMPRMVYGILEIHRSHRIEIPDPARDAEAGRPNACTNCHVERSAEWAARQCREWWGDHFREATTRGDGAPVDLAELAAALLAGDPVQRAVAARLAGSEEAVVAPEQEGFLVALLLEGLRDPYPTVRLFSHQSLRELHVFDSLSEQLASYDYLAPRPRIETWTSELERAWADLADGKLLSRAEEAWVVGDDHLLDRDAADPLIALRVGKEIHVGE